REGTMRGRDGSGSVRGVRLHAALGMLALTACSGGPPPAEPGTIAFTNVTVLPMDREGVLENHTVVVVGETITEVGPADQIEVGEGATVIDGAGRYLMPGLAEMHAHVPPGDAPPRELVED